MSSRLLALFMLASCAPSRAPERAASQAPVGGGWTEVVQRRIAAGNRAFRVEGPGVFSAAQPLVGARARLDVDGVVLGDEDEGLRVRLDRSGEVQIGRVTPVFGACTAEETPTGDCMRRVEYRYPGITEHWTNRQDGLEQVFEVAEPPADEGPLTLTLAVEGALSLAVEDNEGWLLDQGGRFWTVSGLWAWDADGQPLQSWMEADGDALVVHVETAGARFPITVDPVYTTAETTLTGAEGGDYFGFAVAGAGDVDADGYADVAVTALGANDSQGAVYVFHGSASGLSTTAAVELSGADAAGSFGNSLAGAGDVNGDGYDDIVIGDYLGETTFGEALVYYGSADGIDATASTTLSGPRSRSYFGWAVAGAGDVNGDGYDDVIVGASQVASGEDAVWIYHGGADGVDTTATTSLSLALVNAFFGMTLDGAGDVNGDGYNDVLIGAPLAYDGVGEAYVYFGSSAGVDDADAATLEAGASFGAFGISLAGVGDVNADGYDDVLVGAYVEGFYAGAAYLFLGAEDGPEPEATTRFTSGGRSDWFGYHVSAAGDIDGDGYDDIAITGIAMVTSAGLGAGGVNVYHGATGDGPDTDAATTLGALGESTGYGERAAGIGDVDGDGNDDLIVGAPYTDASVGAAYVYLGYSQDEDGDGFLGDEDCDDADADVYPGATERCDGKDSDCDGALPEDELDGDADTWLICAGDCDDADPSVHPETEELTGDGVDQDCDGGELCHDDGDSDGARAETVRTSLDADCLDAGEALGEAAVDCDDADPTVLPGVEEACDGKDTDCNGATPADEDDLDADGAMVCEGDCDDRDPAFGPQVSDTPDDGVDQDCDGEDAHIGQDGDDPGLDETGKGGGCGCATGPRGGGLSWLAGLGLALGLARRRARGAASKNG